MHSPDKHLILLLLLPLLAGCAATISTGSPWDPAEERFFDDGIDVIKDYSQLSGQWAFDAEEELTGRVNLSDIIAEVTISSVLTNKNTADIEEKRIQITFNKMLYGKLTDKNIILSANQNTKGYTLIKRHEDSLKGKHLLFLRLITAQNGMSNHFHISPASEFMSGKVNSLIEKRKKAEALPVK